MKRFAAIIFLSSLITVTSACNEKVKTIYTQSHGDDSTSIDEQYVKAHKHLLEERPSLGTAD